MRAFTINCVKVDAPSTQQYTSLIKVLQGELAIVLNAFWNNHFCCSTYLEIEDFHLRLQCELAEC